LAYYYVAKILYIYIYITDIELTIFKTIVINMKHAQLWVIIIQKQFKYFLNYDADRNIEVQISNNLTLKVSTRLYTKLIMEVE